MSKKGSPLDTQRLQSRPNAERPAVGVQRCAMRLCYNEIQLNIFLHNYWFMNYPVPLYKPSVPIVGGRTRIARAKAGHL